MAERNRRGEEAVDADLDDLLGDDDAEEIAADDEPRDKAAANGKSNGKASIDKPPVDPGSKTKTAGRGDKGPGIFGIFGRFIRFVREIAAELRKVIWPTRKELLTYTAVVIVFVIIMLTIVGLLDYGFAKAMLLVFGGGS